MPSVLYRNTSLPHGLAIHIPELSPAFDGYFCVRFSSYRSEEVVGGLDGLRRRRSDEKGRIPFFRRPPRECTDGVPQETRSGAWGHSSPETESRHRTCVDKLGDSHAHAH